MDDWKLKPPPQAPAVPPPHEDKRRMRYWFIRIGDAQGPAGFTEARSWVSRAGKIEDGRLGTAESPKAAWYVVRCRCASIQEVRGRLGPDSARVDRVEEVSHPAHGTTLARQMPLIG